MLLWNCGLFVNTAVGVYRHFSWSYEIALKQVAHEEHFWTCLFVSFSPMSLFLSTYICLSICLSVSLSICVSVCVCACMYVILLLYFASRSSHCRSGYTSRRKDFTRSTQTVQTTCHRWRRNCCRKMLNYRYVSNCGKTLNYRYVSNCGKTLNYRYVSNCGKTLNYRYVSNCGKTLNYRYVSNCR